jgi:hypothetical protein
MVLTCLIVDDNAAFLEAAAALLEREGRHGGGGCLDGRRGRFDERMS